MLENTQYQLTNRNFSNSPYRSDIKTNAENSKVFTLNDTGKILPQLKEPIQIVTQKQLSQLSDRVGFQSENVLLGTAGSKDMQGTSGSVATLSSNESKAIKDTKHLKIIQSGKKIDLSMSFKFSGDKLDNTTKATFLKNVAAYYGQKFGEYTITAKANEDSSSPYLVNIVENAGIPKEPTRSNISGKTLNLYYKSSPWTSAHEVGHQIFDWDDHYMDVKDKKTGEVIDSIPKKGWEKTLMGEYGQQLSLRELECLIGLKNDC